MLNPWEEILLDDYENHMQLADAVAIYNHDYFHRGLKMQFRIY